MPAERKEKRKRLADAFPRPLDKKRRQQGMVRDSFSFPEARYAELTALKARLQKSGIKAKRSELLCAGLSLLLELDDQALQEILRNTGSQT